MFLSSLFLILLFIFFFIFSLFFYYINIARFFISFFHQVAVKGKRYPATLQFARKFVCSGVGVQEKKFLSTSGFQGAERHVPLNGRKITRRPFFPWGESWIEGSSCKQTLVSTRCYKARDTPEKQVSLSSSPVLRNL